ncbi:MAG: ComEC/Rec2 family competence protein [Candidatus Moranbacteria bacterium]|nr:ComEC/Rec2 family competence protein [Candidatus Moranbacteria bacterium]
MEKDQVFFWGVFSFIIGVAGGSFFAVPLVLFLLCGSAFCIALLIALPQRFALALVIFFFTFFGGVYLALAERQMFETLSIFPSSVQGEVRVVADPEERDFFRRVLVRFETCASGACPTTRVLWQAPLSTPLEAGTRLAFSCQLEQPKNFNDQFDYRMFLAKDGIGYICFQATEAIILPQDRAGLWRSWLYHPKHVLEQILSQIAHEPEAGLAKGLLLGGDNYLPQALKAAFTEVGLSHMIAVSGYNITIIAQMLLYLGLFLGLWRKQAIWTALIGIVFFIIMIGMPASAARAGTMAGIVFVALQTGRLARPLSALLFAGAMMLLFEPLLLRYDLGFQLSFLATLGILWVAPLGERLLSKQHFLLRYLLSIILMTLAVELFVLPIILFSFHTFSPLIIIGNFLVILVPLAMALSFGAALLYFIMPGAHLLFAWPAYVVLTLITRSVEWLGAIGATVTVERFGVGHLFLWYILLGSGIVILAVKFPLKHYEEKR